MLLCDWTANLKQYGHGSEYVKASKVLYGGAPTKAAPSSFLTTVPMGGGYGKGACKTVYMTHTR